MLINFRGEGFKQTTDSNAQENLRAQINALKYELENIRQDKELLTEQHAKELREVKVKAEADYKKAQASDAATSKAARKYDTLAQELREAREAAITEKASFDKRLRIEQEQRQSLQEEVDDALARSADQERQNRHQINDIEAKRAALQEAVDQARREFALASTELKQAQDETVQQRAFVEVLEAENVNLKNKVGDAETLGVVQRELSDQVSHIRKLEALNREQSSELRNLRDAHKKFGVVEEQKRSLEIELQIMRDVERQLGESELQRELLQDERRTWTSLLEREGQESEFDSPEAVVKALVHVRIENASLVDRVGQAEAELAEKDEMTKNLEKERTSLKAEIKTLRSAGASSAKGTDAKAMKRLEQQKALALREVKLLREQLKTYDSEETMLVEGSNFDTQKARQIEELELLVDKYRVEIQTLSEQLSTFESHQQSKIPTPPPASEPSPSLAGTKRPLEEDNSDDAQLGPLLRKNKSLQHDLSKSISQSKLLETELRSTKKQLKSLRSQPRILAMTSNPTSDFEKVKLSTLNILKSENTALLAQLRGDSETLQNVKMVPISTLEAKELAMHELEATIKQREKELARRRDFFADKAAEFRETVLNVLGWKVNFMKNGKARLTSLFYMSPGGDKDAAAVDEDDENAILFDGERRTMQFSGGGDSDFARECRDAVRYWVEQRKEIPCFLAALTIEFYESSMRAVG